MSSARVNREQFLARLKLVEPGTTSRSGIESTPQSSCIAFQDGWLFTYNDDISCRIESGLEESFHGAVKAEPLIKLLDGMGEEDVDIRLTDTFFIVNGINKRGRIAIQKEVVLSISAVETPVDWFQLPDDFANAVSLVVSCTGTNPKKFKAMCVHITEDYMEATDNFQAARYVIKTGVKTECLVKGKILENVIELGISESSETATWLHFKSPSGLIFSCRRCIMPYPAIGDALSVQGEGATLPGGLDEVLNNTKIFNDELVRIDLIQGSARIKGEGQDGDYQELRQMKYDGPPISFSIPPKVLAEVAKKHKDCEITPDFLKVSDGQFSYISCLRKDSDHQVKEEEVKTETEEE